MKRGITALAFALPLLLAFGCGGNANVTTDDIPARLCEMVTLRLHQAAYFAEEDLKIEYIHCSDGRCPWESEAACAVPGKAGIVVKASVGEITQNVPLVQPGLTSGFVTEEFHIYQIHANALPYPWEGMTVAPDSRLQLIVTK